MTILPRARSAPKRAVSPEADALRVRGLSVSFPSRRGPVRAVRDVNLDVTARALMGLHEGTNATVTADSVEVAGHDVLRCSPEELRRLRGATVSMVFQDALSALNPVLSIGDQIVLMRSGRIVQRS